MAKKINNKHLLGKIDELRKSLAINRRDRPGYRRNLYAHLEIIYRAFIEFNKIGMSKKIGRRLVKLLDLPINRSSHLIRVLVEAASGTEDNRTKIKWSQALRYAHGWMQRPERLEWFFEVNKGISGCARMQAINDGTSRKKSTVTGGQKGAQSASFTPSDEMSAARAD